MTAEPVLVTARLALREMAIDDLDFLAEMLRDPQVMRYYPSLQTRSEALAWIRRQRKRYEVDGYGLWLVEDRETGERLGQVGLVLQKVEGERLPEIGYMIHRPNWRRGFAAEAAVAVRDYAFENLGFKQVYSLILPENVPSQGVAKKLGMKPERTVTFHDLPHLLFTVRRHDGADKA